MTGPRPAEPPADRTTTWSPPKRRRPTKYVPRQVNPEWAQWTKGHAIEQCRTMGVHPSWYFPEDDGKAIPDEGAWICVIDPPHMQLVDFDLPHLSMWRATRHEGSRLAKDLPFPFQQAVINTPGGTVHLWPTEYIVINDITVFAGQEPDCIMHSLGGQPLLDEDQMFYLMLRGITRQDAAKLLLGDIRQQDFAYFTFSEEYQQIFAGVGVPLSVYVARGRARRQRQTRTAI